MCLDWPHLENSDGLGRIQLFSSSVGHVLDICSLSKQLGRKEGFFSFPFPYGVMSDAWIFANGFCWWTVPKEA